MAVIPKYVQELMHRSEYEYTHKRAVAGYTLRIAKSTPQTLAKTFQAELERLVKWANRAGGEGTAELHQCPQKTHYTAQYAIVTIYDPVMQRIEKYIPTKEIK